MLVFCSVLISISSIYCHSLAKAFQASSPISSPAKALQSLQAHTLDIHLGMPTKRVANSTYVKAKLCLVLSCCVPKACHRPPFIEYTGKISEMICLCSLAHIKICKAFKAGASLGAISRSARPSRLERLLVPSRLASEALKACNVPTHLFKHL